MQSFLFIAMRLKVAGQHHILAGVVEYAFSCIVRSLIGVTINLPNGDLQESIGDTVVFLSYFAPNFDL